MSTFYNLLKKAENSKAENSTPEKNLPKQPKDVPAVLAIILIIAVFAVVFTVSKAWYAKKQAEKEALAKKSRAAYMVSSSASDKKTTVKKPIPVPVKKVYNGYELEGVICKEDGCIAVINGKLLKLHDRIDNLEVTDITANTAELENKDNNSITALELK